MNQSTLAEALARLHSLKSNLPQTFESDEKYIKEFHEVLDLLERVSAANLGNFRIPGSEIHPETVGGNTITGETYYSGKMVCERSFFMMKIDAVLGFFSFQASPAKKNAIGFNPK